MSGSSNRLVASAVVVAYGTSIALAAILGDANLAPVPLGAAIVLAVVLGGVVARWSSTLFAVLVVPASMTLEGGELDADGVPAADWALVVAVMFYLPLIAALIAVGVTVSKVLAVRIASTERTGSRVESALV